MQVFFSVMVSYLPYSFVTAFTPGPNNVVALHSASQKGWCGSRSVLLGMVSGFWCVAAITAVLCYALAQLLPAVTAALKYIGAAYIVYLAVHIALSRPDSGAGGQITFFKGFLLQFVNVKIILYDVTVYTGYLLPCGTGLAALMLHAVIMTAVSAMGNLTWAAAGGALRRLLERHYRPINIAMALVLLWSAAAMVLDI